MKQILFLVFFVVSAVWCNAAVADSTLLRTKKDSAFYLSPLKVNGYDEVQSDILEEEAVFSNDSIQRQIDLARTIFAKVRSAQNFITNIDANSKFELPVGISKTIGGISYDIAIHAVRIKPTHAELDVFMQLEVPQNGKTLTFMARGIKLSKAGGIVGDARLELLGDFPINFSGDKIQLVLKGGQQGTGTYVTMDCDGFKEMGIDANVIFSRDLLVPENVNGTVQPAGRVSASFKSILSNWNDLIVQVSLPDFQVTSLKGFGFTVQNAVFDFSDLRNAPNVKFPENYNADFANPQLANLWRGIYMRELSVRLPQELKSKNAAGRITLAGYDLLLDNNGFSGTVSGTNLIPIDYGDMSGWAFSLDSVGVELRANTLVAASLDGDIIIPVGDKQKPFGYTAMMDANGDYFFSVVSQSDMNFPLFKAGKVEIYAGSSLQVVTIDHRFFPKAILHGKMTIQPQLSDGGQGVELADIRFENLEIQAVKPYIKVGAFSFGSEALQQKMAGFPVSINNIGMKNLSDTDVALDFDLKLNLVGESSGSFAADAGLTVIGTMNSDAGMQSWRYKDVQLRSIAVDIDGGAFKINGSLTFYRNDLVYGDGFNGMVNAEFQPGIKVKATAIFGNVKGMRYWYADAMAEFKPGIPIFTGVAIYGFGGGAYYKMKVADTGGSELGKTASGIVYMPSAESGLGLKASISIGSSPSPEAFTADATFEIAFYDGGGVRYISFMGNGFLATPPVDGVLAKVEASTKKMTSVVSKMDQKLSSATKGLLNANGPDETTIKQIHGEVGKAAGEKGQVSARVFISYDFENKVLHGNFNVNINAGGGLITGGGEAVLHFAPSEWYVYVGTPDQRFNLGLGIGPLKANADAYFMVGTKIPGSPPPPAEVSRILAGKNFDYMKDLNTIGTGGGFAFGTSFSVSTGDLQFLMFYANFSAGAGFDIMLKNYGDARCAGSNQRIGVNGWYANGQAYGYFEGKIGISVKVFGKRKSVEILSLAAAAVLQAQLPNPFWMQGTVGGRFSVLGGLVKGNCQFQVTLGEKCEIIQNKGSMLDNIQVIAQLTPDNAEKNVNVFNTPQAVFNMPVEQLFQLEEDNVQKSFRIKLDQFQLTADGQPIQGSLQWNDTHDVVAFNSFEVLPPKKEVKASAKVSFEELKNGMWLVVTENGQKITESKEVTFTTGEAPDYIPLENVEYSYPVVGQLNYYKEESNEGYIKLKKGQTYLFTPGAEWRQTGRFTAADKTKSEFGFTYANNTVSFTTPSNLRMNQLYAFELVNVPAQSGTASVDRNVSQSTNKVSVNGESLDTEVTGKKAEGTISELQEKNIFSAFFRASKYGRLSDKIAAQPLDPTLRGLRVLWRVHYLKTSLQMDEPFDQAELSGTAFTGNKPLIKVEADFSGNAYYNDIIYPLIYEGYPLDGVITISREPSLIGLPPTRSVRIIQTPADLGINQQSPENFSLQAQPYFLYDAPYYMNADFTEIQYKAANRYLVNGGPSATPRIEKILWSQFPMITKGQYKITLKYYKPGSETLLSQRQVVMDNPIE